MLRDVAGMVRSFHYAAYTALLGRGADQARRPVGRPHRGLRRNWRRGAGTGTRGWPRRSSASYRETAGSAPFLPDSHAEFKILIEAFVLSKAVYELGYELGHRPDWVSVPLLGILDILKTPRAVAHQRTDRPLRA